MQKGNYEKDKNKEKREEKMKKQLENRERKVKNTERNNGTILWKILRGKVEKIH